MTPEPIKLAQALVELPWWRWVPGMRRLTFDAGYLYPSRVADDGTHSEGLFPIPAGHLYPSRVADDGTYPDGLFPIPDLTDPATFGALLLLTTEHASALVSVSEFHGGWAASLGPGRTGKGDHPGVALARAILAASPPV